MNGAVERARIAHAADAWVAWHTSYLPRSERPVSLPELSGVKTARQRPRKTWEAQLVGWAAYANARAH